MVNIEKINSKLSEAISTIISEDRKVFEEDFPIKRFVINSIENVTAKSKGFGFAYKADNKPCMAFKVNASITFIHPIDKREIYLENIDFTWIADEVDHKGYYTWTFGEKLADMVWPGDPYEIRPDYDKATKEYVLKLTDIYTENYFTHERETPGGIHYFFLYNFSYAILFSFYDKLKIDNEHEIYSNSMLKVDERIIANLLLSL